MDKERLEQVLNAVGRLKENAQYFGIDGVDWSPEGDSAYIEEAIKTQEQQIKELAEALEMSQKEMFIARDMAEECGYIGVREALTTQMIKNSEILHK